jgi:hypothetical protein
MTAVDQVLTFDAAQHIYRLGQRTLPSVTTVLKTVGLIDGTWFTADAAVRGTHVHTATELFDKGVLDMSTVDPGILPYLRAYTSFLLESGATWTAIEQRLYDGVRGYAGTLDREGTINGERCILDIKTGPPQPWHRVQLAGYADLIREPGEPVKRWGLWLQKSGIYRLLPYTDRSDRSVFRAALTLAQFKEVNKC